MVRITRVYTRKGDKGETRLVGGKRVPKDSLRIEAYGTIDELNSIVGLARVFNEEAERGGRESLGQDSRPLSLSVRGTQTRTHRFLDEVLRKIQDELFDLGSELAAPPDLSYEGTVRIGEREVKRLEGVIDECQKELRPLRSFVLPGGGKIGAHLHQCRTVCRRAERIIVRLARVEATSEWVIQYVNRLSDLFFVLARWVGNRLGEKEYLWERGLREKPKRKK